MAKRRQYGSGSVYQRKSDGRWVGAVVVDTRTNRRITVTAKTEVEAKRKLDAKKREIARHGAPAPGIHPHATVKVWAEDWLKQQAQKLRPRSYSATSSAVNTWIVPTIGHKRLTALTPADIRSVTDTQIDAGRALSSARRTHAELKRMLTDAIQEGHQVPERVLTTKMTSTGAKRERTDIPLAEAVAILGAASRRPDASRWVAALMQGMRQGECLGLTWPLVDLDAGVLDISWQLQAIPYVDNANKHLGFRVPRGYEMHHLERRWHLVRPKTARGQRVIPLSPWMRRALEDWRDIAPDSPYGLVWPNDDGSPRDPADDTRTWKALQVEAGTSRRYLLHEARHTAATMLFEQGVDHAVITSILGHSSIITSRAYQHTRIDQARAALNQVAERLGLEG